MLALTSHHIIDKPRSSARAALEPPIFAFMVALCVVLASGGTNARSEPGPTSRGKPQDAALARVEGTVVYRADPKRRWRYARYYVENHAKGSLAEAVVALRAPHLKADIAPRKPSTVVIDQIDHRFVPESIAIGTGDVAKFTNSDPTLHNVYSINLWRQFDQSIGQGSQFTHVFRRAVDVRRPVVLGCRFHGSMRAWIYVFDHPFFQMTGSDGKFVLENVPPGDYHLETGHAAGSLYASRRLSLEPGQTLKIDIYVSPDDLVKPDLSIK